MGIKYNEAQRKAIIDMTVGKTISSLEYIEDDEYWVMTFTDGTETSFRFMAELI